MIAFTAFPKEHCIKIHSTNPLERLNGEIKRPNEAATVRLVGAILLEQNDEWAVQRPPAYAGAGNARHGE